MKLSEEVKNKIIEILDSKEFKDSLYLDVNGRPLPKEKRDELGQFYTSGKICIRLLEKFKTDSLANKNILDPTCGSGNLLIACLIAGADLDKLYGNEFDADILPTCRHRIIRAAEILGKDTTKFRDYQIHQGNALIKDCLTNFSSEYDITILPRLLKRRVGLTGGWLANPEYYISSDTDIRNLEPKSLFGDF